MAEPNPPRRRWFRFSISTMLILTAIAAWALSLRPYLVVTEEWVEEREVEFLSPMPPNTLWVQRANRGLTYSDGRPILFRIDFRTSLNPRLCWPAIALAVIFISKTISRIRDSRRLILTPLTEPITATVPQRRWSRYSLRALFVAFSVFAGWLGWELKFVRERKDYMQLCMDKRYPCIVASEYAPLEIDKESVPTIPFWRRMLGDKAVLTIGNRFGRDYEEDVDEAERAIEEDERRLFPEAWNYRLQQREREAEAATEL